MKVELFMRSLDQDFSDENSLDYVETNYNNGGHRQRVYTPKNFSEERILSDVNLRSESFGGLLYDLKTKAVFSLDHNAYDAINDLLNGISFEDLSVKSKFPNEDIVYLKEKLKKYHLCTN